MMLVLVAASLVAVANALGGALNHGLVLFWSDRGQPGPALWEMRPDGSHQHVVYRTSRNAKRPVLSPDRAWIAFDGASPGKKPFSDFDVQIVRAAGGRWREPARSSSTPNGHQTGTG
jgi:Tol biopolymer transport system component